jgi:hypothetical protein
MIGEKFLISPCVRASFCSVPSEGEGRQNDAQHILSEEKAAREQGRGPAAKSDNKSRLSGYFYRTRRY